MELSQGPRFLRHKIVGSNTLLVEKPRLTSHLHEQNYTSNNGVNPNIFKQTNVDKKLFMSTSFWPIVSLADEEVKYSQLSDAENERRTGMAMDIKDGWIVS